MQCHILLSRKNKKNSLSSADFAHSMVKCYCLTFWVKLLEDNILNFFFFVSPTV